MAQQTAVDYLVEKLNQCEPFYSGIISLKHKQYIDGLIDNAKAMEKEQIIEAFLVNYSQILWETPNPKNEAEEYYNEEYGNKKVL